MVTVHNYIITRILEFLCPDNVFCEVCQSVVGINIVMP